MGHEPARAPRNLEKYFLYSQLLLILYQKGQGGGPQSLSEYGGLHVNWDFVLGLSVRNSCNLSYTTLHLCIVLEVHFIPPTVYLFLLLNTNKAKAL